MPDHVRAIVLVLTKLVILGYMVQNFVTGTVFMRNSLTVLAIVIFINDALFPLLNEMPVGFETGVEDGVSSEN